MNPVTEAVHKYLRDRAATVRESWSEGENWTEEAKIRVEDWEDIADIDADTINQFYEEPDEQEAS